MIDDTVRAEIRRLAILRRYLRKFRGPRSRKAHLRVETVPGEQAQVD